MDTLEKLSDCFCLKIAIPRNFSVNLLEIIEVACEKISPVKILSVFSLDEENMCQIFVKDLETFCFLLREGICIGGVQLSPLPCIACYTVYCPYPMVTNDNLIELFSNYGTVLKVNHINAFPNRKQLDHIISEKRRVIFYLAGQESEMYLPEVVNEKVGNWCLSLKVVKFCIACLQDGHDILNCSDLRSFALEQDCSNKINLKSVMREGQQSVSVVNTNIEQKHEIHRERNVSPESDDIMESVINTMNESDDDNSSGTDFIETIGDFILNEEITEVDKELNSVPQVNKKIASPSISEEISFPQQVNEVNKEITTQEEVNKEIILSQNNGDRSPENDSQQKMVTSSTNRDLEYYRNLRKRELKKNLSRSSCTVNLRYRHEKERYKSLSFDSDEFSDSELKTKRLYRKRSKDRNAMSEPQMNDSQVYPEKIIIQSSSADTSEESIDQVSKDYRNRNRKSRKRLPSLSDTDSLEDFKRPHLSSSINEKALKDSIYFKDLQIPDVKLGILDNNSLREFLIASEETNDILQLSSTFTAFKDKLREQISNLCDALDFKKEENYEHYKKLMKIHKELW